MQGSYLVAHFYNSNIWQADPGGPQVGEKSEVHEGIHSLFLDIEMLLSECIHCFTDKFHICLYIYMHVCIYKHIHIYMLVCIYMLNFYDLKIKNQKCSQVKNHNQTSYFIKLINKH